MEEWLREDHAHERTATVPNSDVLLTVEPELRPLLFECDESALYLAMFQWAQQGLTVRVVRGRKMWTERALFDEFAAALQFPLYFGENRNAFNECIADLEALSAGGGYVVVITEPDDVLVGEDEHRLHWLVDSLSSAGRGWAVPIERGVWEDDGPVAPFHVVLVGQREVLERASRRWTAAGAEIQAFEWLEDLSGLDASSVSWSDEQIRGLWELNESRKAEREEKERQWRLASQPILADLCEVGVEVDDISRLYNDPESFPVIFPVVMKHLERGKYPERVMKSLARVMAVEEAAPYWRQLRDLYLKATELDEIEGLAVALGVSAQREHLDELIALLDVPARGHTQVLFLQPIMRLGRE